MGNYPMTVEAPLPSEPLDRPVSEDAFELAENVEDSGADFVENLPQGPTVGESWLQGKVGVHLHIVVRFDVVEPYPCQFCAWLYRPRLLREQGIDPGNATASNVERSEPYLLQGDGKGRDYMVFVSVRQVGEDKERMAFSSVSALLRLVLLDDLDVSGINSCEMGPHRRFPRILRLGGWPHLSTDRTPADLDELVNEYVESGSIVLQRVSEYQTQRAEVHNSRQYDEIAAGVGVEVETHLDRWPSVSFEQSNDFRVEGFAMLVSPVELRPGISQ